MESLTKKKRGCTWSEEDLKAAMDAVRNNRLSQRKAADTYNIPRRTLRNHIKSGSSKKVIGKVPTLTVEQEKDLVSRIIRFAEVGVPLTPKAIRKQAYAFCEVNGIANNFNDKKGTAGKVWLKKFLRQNPEIAKRKAQFMNPARAQKLNKYIVNQHFLSVKKLYDDLDIVNHPERLYNVDEKGCRLTLHHQPQVLAEKGSRRVHLVSHEHGENVSIAACVNAMGNAIPPMVIFKGRRLRPEFTDNLPIGSLVKMAAKGSMTTELFIDFINHFAKYKSSGKCLLIFDGAKCHLDYRIVETAENQNIVLYCLPSNTTHELQPLDKSVNRSFEHYWDEEVLTYSYQHPDKKLTKARFNVILSKVWPKCMTQNNITSGFRATGLYPWDPSAIPEVAFAPSALTELPEPGCNVNNRQESVRFSEIDQSRHSDLRSFTARNDGSSDSDLTMFDEEFNDPQSPSVLNEITQAVENYSSRQSYSVLEEVREIPIKFRLVDYSSSSEASITDITTLKKPQSKTAAGQPFSPQPSTSKAIVRWPVINNSSSDTSDAETQDIQFRNLILDRSVRYYNNVYGSLSSESEPENMIPPSTEISTPSKQINIPHFNFNTRSRKPLTIYTSDESQDEMSLSEIVKKRKKLDTQKSPFQNLLPTPNFANVKTKSRRKAINYKGIEVTKDLFKDNSTDEKENVQRKKKIGKEKLKNKKKGETNDQKKTRKTAMKKKSEKKRNKSVWSRKNNDAWYCYGCNLERIAVMRQCKECKKWYHEDCIGLTKEDKDFLCPDCD